MKIKSVLSLMLLLGIVCCSVNSYADEGYETAAPATAAKEEAVSAPAQPQVEQTQAPSAAATASPAQTTAAPVEAAVPAAEEAPAIPAPSTDVPNPYTNVSNSEFYSLQQLASELKADADKGLRDAEPKEHGGRYGEDNYIAMRKSFAEAAGTLDTTLRTAPVDIRKVHMTIKALKTIVVDLDDVFVYNPGFLNHLRNWNECKRVLRRVDGVVYREGQLRRVERIWDANQFFRDVGKFFNAHGLLSGVEDHLHRTNPTGPMDSLVGRHGGGRRVTHVWMLPSSTYNSQMTNDRSAFNEDVQQY